MHDQTHPELVAPELPAAPDGMTSQDWLELDRQYRIQTSRTRSICFVRGEGLLLWDVEGRQYLDFEAGQACVATGHSHPAYLDALHFQANRLIQTGTAYTDPEQIKLLRKLAEITPPPFQKSYLACSGSEANEAAIRLAKAYTGRFEIVALLGNNHGNTAGSWSATGKGGAARLPYGPGMPGVTFLPTPFSFTSPDQPDPDDAAVDACLRVCNAILDESTTGQPAAIMVELVQSAAGVRVLPPAFVRALRQMCTERGALMIVDEALTGVGRTGRWWAFEHYGIVPDVITSSKMLGGGVPLSAVITSAAIADAAVARGFLQSSSHTGDPLLAAAGLATLEIIQRDGLIRNVETVGATLKQGLQRIAQSSPIVGAVSGLGLLLGVEFIRSKESRPEPNPGAARATVQACQERGLLLGTAARPNVLRIMPPYILTMTDVADALERLQDALREVEAAQA